MAVVDRLIGADGSLWSMSFGATLSAGNCISGSWYKIATVSGTTIFPAGYIAGDLVIGNGQALSATNSAALATPTLVSDCTEFTMQFSAAEVDVTTLADNVKKYRKGKIDLTGTIKGNNTISEMRKTGSFLNRFLRMVATTSAYVSTFNALAETALYGQFFLNDSTTSGETQVFLFGQIDLYGYNLGAAIGDVQAYESGIRFIGNDPMVYFKDNT